MITDGGTSSVKKSDDVVVGGLALFNECSGSFGDVTTLEVFKWLSEQYKTSIYSRFSYL